MSNTQVAQTEVKNESIKDYVNKVQEQFNEMNKESSITLPPNYSVGNAVKSAYLKLLETKTGKNDGYRPVLEVCSKSSIANALLEMVIQGLSPAKNQCYFIAYGKQLQLMRSYMGTVAVTKRIEGIKDVKAYCIYEGDEFDTEYNADTATINVTKFKPGFGNVDIEKIKGAFAVIIGESGPVYTEIMTMAQIKSAWGQGQTKGNSGAHQNFAEEMAKKTVINRACKMFVNTSDDSDVLVGAFNATTENEYKGEEESSSTADIKAEIAANANSQVIDIPAQEVKPEDVEIIPPDKQEAPKATGQMKIDSDPGF